MLQALDHPIEIVIFGFEFADRCRRMRGDEDFFSGFVEHRDLHVTEGFRWHIVLELVEQFDVFIGQFEDRAPDLLARRRDDTRKPASPLRRPAAELDGVVGESRQHLKLVFGRPSFELYGMEIVSVEEKLHTSRVASWMPSKW